MKQTVIAEFMAAGRELAPGKRGIRRARRDIEVEGAAQSVSFESGSREFIMDREGVVVSNRHRAFATCRPGKRLWNCQGSTSRMGNRYQRGCHACNSHQTRPLCWWVVSAGT